MGIVGYDLRTAAGFVEFHRRGLQHLVQLPISVAGGPTLVEYPIHPSRNAPRAMKWHFQFANGRTPLVSNSYTIDTLSALTHTRAAFDRCSETQLNEVSLCGTIVRLDSSLLLNDPPFECSCCDRMDGVFVYILPVRMLTQSTCSNADEVWQDDRFRPALPYFRVNCGKKRSRTDCLADRRFLPSMRLRATVSGRRDV